jgi:hypothetical protein
MILSKSRAIAGLTGVILAATSSACIETDHLLFDGAGAGAGAGGGGGGGGEVGSGQTYPEVVKDDGPLAYWRVGEAGTAATAVDASGHGNDALYVADTGVVERGRPGAIAGDPDTAVSLSAGAYIVLDPHALSFTGLAPYTLEAWIRKEATDSGDILTCLGQDGAGYEVLLLGSDIHHKRLAPPEDYDSIGASSVGLSSFRHLVAVFDGSEAQLYLDGVPTSSTNVVFDTPVPAHAGAFRVAASTAGELVVDELAVYDQALSPARIEAHHRCGATAECD